MENLNEEQLKALNEVTETGDIANNPELLKQLELRIPYGNLSAMIGDNRPLSRSTGLIQGIYRDKALNKLVIKEKLVEAVTTNVKTEFTKESIQDLASIYGMDIYGVLATFLTEEVNEELNTNLFTFLDANATVGAPLSFTPAEVKSTADVIFNIKTKINFELAKLARVNKRPMRGWAIVSTGLATAMFVDGYKALSDPDFNEPQNNLYIGTLGAIDYYLNPLHTDPIDVLYVGLKGTGYSGGSVYYLPYMNTILNPVDPETGNESLIVNYRGNISLNPFDVSTGALDSSFLAKASIDITAFNY